MHVTRARCQALRLFSMAVLCFVLPATAASAPTRWEDAPASFVVVRADAPGDMHDFIRAVKEAGGHVAIVHPPRAATVFASPSVLTAPALGAWIDAAHSEHIDDPLAISSEPVLQRAAAVWNATLEIGALGRDDHELELPRAPDAGPVPITRPPAPLKSLAAYDHIPLGAQYYDMSEYLAGTVAIAVYLLEAPPGSSVNWSVSEENWSIAGVHAGMGAWVRKGGSGAFLTFFIESHTQQLVSGVPIENSMSMDDIWVDEVLGNLGYTGSGGFNKCYQHNDALRDAYQTNWAYSIFIADSNPAVNQGRFTNNGYAWAYYGGPWTYMARYCTWAYNSSRYAAVVPMHELGHIFHATDEYDGAQQWKGYLNAPDNPASNPTCIMNRNDSTTVCSYTRNQLAWRDLDGDDIIEPHDTVPEAFLTPSGPGPHPVMPTVTGSGNVTMLPNINSGSNYNPPHDMTVTTVAAIECRVDGGPWSAATASDGAFDGYSEGFSWTASLPLGDGIHVVEARTQSSVGNWTLSYPTDTIEVNSLVAVGPQTNAGFVVLAPRPNPASGAVEIPFSLAKAARIEADVLDIGGRRIVSLGRGERSAGSQSLRWDGRDAAGHEVAVGIYLVRVATAGRQQIVRVVVAR